MCKEILSDLSSIAQTHRTVDLKLECAETPAMHQALFTSCPVCLLDAHPVCVAADFDDDPDVFGLGRQE